MQVDDYTRKIWINLLAFWHPGDRLEIVASFRAKEEDRIECQVCGWPRSSRSTQAVGLVNVLVLKNIDTGKKRLVGENCAVQSQKLLQKIVPDFVIKGLTEAREHLHQLREEERNQLRSARQTQHAPSNHSAPPTHQTPVRPKPSQKPLQYTDSYTPADYYQEDAAEEHWREIQNIVKEGMSEEWWTYMQGEDDFTDIQNDPRRYQGPRDIQGDD